MLLLIVIIAQGSSPLSIWWPRGHIATEAAHLQHTSVPSRPVAKPHRSIFVRPFVFVCVFWIFDAF